MTATSRPKNSSGVVYGAVGIKPADRILLVRRPPPGADKFSRAATDAGKHRNKEIAGERQSNGESPAIYGLDSTLAAHLQGRFVAGGSLTTNKNETSARPLIRLP